MADEDTSTLHEHLLATPVREAIADSTYGSWRSVSAPDAVSLSFGFPFPAALPGSELVAAAETILEEEGARALGYRGGDYAGNLAENVAARERERGIDCDADQVAIANGSTNAINAVCRAFLEPGDAIVVEAPTFMGALSVFGAFGVDIDGVPVDDAGLDVDLLAADLARRREEGDRIPKLVYTIPNFQNPTGTTLPRERRERLLDLAAEYDFVVLEDDAYGDLRYDGEDEPPLAALDDAGRVVRVGTFSKTIAPGIRTGWLVGEESVVEAVDAVNPGGSAKFTRGIVGRYCESGLLEENVAELRADYRDRRDHMLDCLETHMPEGTDWTEPSGGFFVWVDCDVDAERLLPDAADEGVTFLPGTMFYPDGRASTHARISFSYADPEAIDTGIAALGRAIEGARATNAGQ